MNSTKKTKVKLCVKDLMKQYTILGHIRSGYFGDVYALNEGKHTGTTQYNQLPKYKGSRYKYIMKITNNNKTAMEEINMLYQVNKLKSVHLPTLVSHHKCDDIIFRGWKGQGIAKSHQDWTFITRGKGLITIMENSGIGMDIYLKKNTNPMNEIIMLFQLLYTLYFLSLNKIVHNDIYMNNIVSKQVKDTMMTYKIDDHVFKVPILEGHIPVLIDFGQAENSKPNTKMNANTLMMFDTWYNHTKHVYVKNVIDDIYGHITSDLKSIVYMFYNKYIYTTMTHPTEVFN
tara:strand:+ start:3709 stop:4569 length:861 start_codon:yes stop_codon:yes gene_type:complete